MRVSVEVFWNDRAEEWQATIWRDGNMSFVPTMLADDPAASPEEIVRAAYVNAYGGEVSAVLDIEFEDAGTAGYYDATVVTV